MMNLDQTPIGTALHALRFKSEGGREFVPIGLNPAPKWTGAGHPPDNPMLAQLKRALLAESWITIEALVGHDLRSFRTNLYSARQCKLPDERSTAARRDDAIYLVDQVHQKARSHFQQLCGFDVGFSVESILTRGRAAAQKHYSKWKLRELNKFMRNQKVEYSRDAMPGVDDATLATHQLVKIRSLITGVAKCTELLSFVEELKSKSAHGRRGRPRKEAQPKKLLDTLEETLTSKIAFEDPDELFFLAAHSGVNPARLWTNIVDGPARIMEYAVIYGKMSRGLDWSEQDKAFLREYVLPFQLGLKLPKTSSERKICQMIRWNMDACDNTARRLGRPIPSETTNYGLF